MASAASLLPADFKDGEAFVDMLAEVYGAEEASTVLATLAESRTLTYWVNALVPGEFTPIGEPLTGMPGLFVLPRDGDFTASAAATEGKVYIQNASSVLAVRILDPQPGEEVLDLAAAPGGKTIAMAAAMQNEGRIAAVEPVRGRFHRLRANLDRCGVDIAELYLRDGRGVGRAVPERFDRVLLDAPCSSQARMRWNEPATYAHWTRRKVKEASRKQKSLLQSAYAALKPGGRMLYCTCSFAPEENELPVAALLKRSDAELVALDDTFPCRTVSGLTSWQGRKFDARLSRSVRVLPDDIWDGFYLACLAKPG